MSHFNFAQRHDLSKCSIASVFFSFVPFKTNGEVNIYIFYIHTIVCHLKHYCLSTNSLFFLRCITLPKHVSDNVLCIYGLFAAAGERQGSDTLEAVKSCFCAQIKSVAFSLCSFCSLVWPPGGRKTAET